MARMGSLAAQDGYDPNAFDVPGEQSTGVGWANRLGEILTARPQYDETVQYRTASPLVNITEGDIGRATEAAMAVSGGGMKIETPKGIRAYHSSPHDFDKFDLAKIGTGEGAQAYGHGLYFAESPAVSGQGGQYWKQFHDRFPNDEHAAATAMLDASFDRARAIEATRMRLEGGPGNKEQLTNALRLLESGKPVGPRTYEVNINADPAHMLDWDKPLSAQPHVTKTIMDLLPAAERRRIERWEKPSWSEGNPKASYFDTVKGGTEYQGLAGILGKSDAASAALREAGIPGIKYLDQGSRNMVRPTVARNTAMGDIPILEPDPIPKKTHNFVVFDPGIIDIMKKYAVPGAIGAGGMGALAAQDRYQPEERM